MGCVLVPDWKKVKVSDRQMPLWLKANALWLGSLATPAAGSATCVTRGMVPLKSGLVSQ